MVTNNWLKDTLPKAYEAQQRAMESQKKQAPMTHEQFRAQLQRLGRLHQKPKRISDPEAK